jgi:hypothetical protein
MPLLIVPAGSKIGETAKRSSASYAVIFAGQAHLAKLEEKQADRASPD